MVREDIRYALSSAGEAPASAPIVLTGDIYASLRTAAELGYAGIELHLREDDPLDLGRVKAAAAELGVRFSALATGRLCTQGGVNLIDDRPYIVEAALKGMRTYIEQAAALETDLIIGWIKGKVPDGAGRSPYMDRLAVHLKALCAEAAERGVKVFVEVINRYETNIFTTAAETLDFIDSRGILNCFVHLDTFHMNIEETDAIEAIRAAGKRLGYFHVADNTRRYPGSGTLDFIPVLSALKETGYRGFVSVECLPWPDGKTAAERAIGHLKSCEKTLGGIR
ncbi:MAG: sugar phosphate isomerase/epimerase [Spirochaetaceae bacterium]|nr:sugar phosphate isomerase/epimerase [Spirochaetaceae bacterium]